MRVALLAAACACALGCQSSSTSISPTGEQDGSGSSKYKYIAADGGPHIVLPVEDEGAWSGGTSMASVDAPQSDYGRACAATRGATKMAVIKVGAGKAIVLADPPLSSFGTSADGFVEIYDLESWGDRDADALLDRATASLATNAMTDTGETLEFTQPDAWMLYAGDTPTSVAYDLHRIAIPAGKYRVLSGKYSKPPEEVLIYRLRPVGR